jgi:hypothetical protein
MKIQEIISEARHNPRQNLGKPDRRELLQYLHSLPDEVRSRMLITSATIDKIGINPRDQVYAPEALGHVTGVYCWTADMMIENNGSVPYAEIRPYQFVIELKEQPTELTEELWDELWDEVYQRVPDPHNDPNHGRDVIPKGVLKAGAVAAHVLKEMGISALVDPDGIISGNEGEAILVSLSAIKHYKRYVNHITPGANLNSWEGSPDPSNILAHASGDKLLKYAARTNKLLSAEQEKKLLNLFPLSPEENRHSHMQIFANIKSYIDQVLIPNRQKFQLSELNRLVLTNLKSNIDFYQQQSDETEVQKLSPYLRYFSG